MTIRIVRLPPIEAYQSRIRHLLIPLATCLGPRPFPPMRLRKGGVGRGGKGLATRPNLARTNAGMQARVLECN